MPDQGVATGAGPAPAPAAAPAPTPVPAPGLTNGADTGEATQETSRAQVGSSATPAEGVHAQHINQQKTHPRPQSAAIAAPLHPFPTQFKSNTGKSLDSFYAPPVDERTACLCSQVCCRALHTQHRIHVHLAWCRGGWQKLPSNISSAVLSTGLSR